MPATSLTVDNPYKHLPRSAFSLPHHPKVFKLASVTRTDFYCIMMSSLTVPDGLLHRSREEIVGNCQKDTHFQKKIKNNFNQSDE